MSCNCKNRNGTKGIPHTIKPGDSCIFCAEKHIGLAWSCLASTGLKPGSRQEIIGELELARRHTFVAYPELAAVISEGLEALLLRRDLATISGKVKEAVEMSGSLATATENGNDTTRSVYVPGTGVPSSPTPFAGELFYSAGWRLACECGYWNENKGMIIGDLAAAQFHIFRWSSELSDKMRDIRHSLHNLSVQQVDQKWFDLAAELDSMISPVAIDIASKYGTDLSWYLNR